MAPLSGRCARFTERGFYLVFRLDMTAMETGRKAGGGVQAY